MSRIRQVGAVGHTTKVAPTGRRGGCWAWTSSTRASTSTASMITTTSFLSCSHRPSRTPPSPSGLSLGPRAPTLSGGGRGVHWLARHPAASPPQNRSGHLSLFDDLNFHCRGGGAFQLASVVACLGARVCPPSPAGDRDQSPRSPSHSSAHLCPAAPRGTASACALHTPSECSLTPMMAVRLLHTDPGFGFW